MEESNEPTIFNDTDTQTSKKSSRKGLITMLLIGIVIFDLFFVVVFALTRAPSDFPLNSTVTIESGLSASAAADTLEESRVVRSAGLLYAIILLFHDPAAIKAGAYVFSDRASAFSIATIITSDAPSPNLIPVTFPEGFNVEDYARIASAKISGFDTDTFINMASSSEGYLFPDTYHVPTDYSEQELFELLRDTYEQKMKPIRTELTNSDLAEDDLVTLASIVEREANSSESMGIVAGILRERLRLGMPLQTDATMEYVLHKPLKELTAEDLKIDTPYNTYLYPGLPPTPIGNPGAQAMEAVLHPTATEYLYYLTDEDGEFHYAKTYQEHQQNITRYLK